MQALFRDLDLETADVAIERALELDSSLACAHYLRGTVWTVAGRHEEATGSLLRALALAPQDTDLHVAVGQQLFVMRRFDEARRVFQEVDELLRQQGRGDIVCMTCLELLVRIELIEGNEAETALPFAHREMARLREVGEDAPSLDPSRPRESLRRYWRWWLRELPHEGAFVERAALHLALGERREALASLHRVPLHREDLTRIYLRWDPRFDDLRQDPEFGEIVEAVFEHRAHPGTGTTFGLQTARQGPAAQLQPAAVRSWLLDHGPGIMNPEGDNG
jgi:tetratricopeptide (TPR) repeat protein